jgi:hypothetical protein
MLQDPKLSFWQQMRAWRYPSTPLAPFMAERFSQLLARPGGALKKEEQADLAFLRSVQGKWSHALSSLSPSSRLKKIFFKVRADIVVHLFSHAFFFFVSGNLVCFLNRGEAFESVFAHYLSGEDRGAYFYFQDSRCTILFGRNRGALEEGEDQIFAVVSRSGKGFRESLRTRCWAFPFF